MNKEYHPGVSPLEHAKRKQAEGREVNVEKAREETMAGLTDAIKATKRRIAENRSKGADITDLNKHLKGLERQLESAKR
ncbi:MAG: hypothetical protein AAB461_02845 [Patescibacteria group bacterium]